MRRIGRRACRSTAASDRLDVEFVVNDDGMKSFRRLDDAWVVDEFGISELRRLGDVCGVRIPKLRLFDDVDSRIPHSGDEFARVASLDGSSDRLTVISPINECSKDAPPPVADAVDQMEDIWMSFMLNWAALLGSSST